MRLSDELRSIEGHQGIRPKRGDNAWGKRGIAISLMTELPVTLYSGDIFDANCAAVIPKDSDDLLAIWSFCRSDEYCAAVRRIDQKLNVTNATLVKVPFDLEHWQKVAAKEYPNGLPEPHSDDPTQWLFKGHPEGSTDPLQVAVARMLGYRWPDQEPDELDALADADGIVPVPGVRHEPPAADRLMELLQTSVGRIGNPSYIQAAYIEGSDGPGMLQDDEPRSVGRIGNPSYIQAAYIEGSDGPGMLQDDEPRSVGRIGNPSYIYGLLAKAGCRPGTSLDEWLRTQFFEQHCKRFHNRPFIWHIWDGRKDGFSALVNYHKLDYNALENLTYSYLGDWISAQSKSDKVGADLRLAAAQALQEKLKLILAGEPPYDIFVRWKPLHEQAIGWHPDLNDGVRMNIRPFIEAGILRKNPNIKWGKDRGKEPERDKDEYPWFWKGKDPVGDRVNDVHLANAEKLKKRK
jgi:hypothetical protein